MWAEVKIGKRDVACRREESGVEIGTESRPGGAAVGAVTEEQLRQALLERYTPRMYEKISRGAAAIAGPGGLGSHIAVMLARAGVGHLFLVDSDRVEITNLNRQAYDITHLGQPKTEALAGILRKINPYIKAEARNITVTEKNAQGLFGEYPILCEAFDRPEQKAMLVNAVLQGCPHTVVISGCGMAGYGSANRIVTQKKMGRLYVAGDGETELGPDTCLMASRVMVCAAHQANMAIRLLLGEEKP